MPTLTQKALVADLALAAHGVPITVTLPDAGGTYTDAGIWLDPIDEPQPYGHDYGRREPRRALKIRRTVAHEAIPRGATITAADRLDASARTYRVDGLVHPDDPMWTVLSLTVLA